MPTSGFRRAWVPVAAAAAALLLGAAGARAVTIAAAEPSSTGDRAIFEPLAPVRLVDTRKAGQGPALAANSQRQFLVAGANGIPADAVAVVLNITAVLPTRDGFLVAWPAGAAKPTASNVNFKAGQIVPNLATVKIGTGGNVSIFNNSIGTTHLVVDISGYYRGHAHDDRYLLATAAQARTAANAFACNAGLFLQAVAADGAPTCASGPAYGAGHGLWLDGATFHAQQGREAKDAFTCPVDALLQAVAEDGAPTCVGAGAGLRVEDGLLVAEQGRSVEGAFSCEPGHFLRVVAADGTPTCNPDQAGPTYTAGAGIVLSGGQIVAAAGTTVVPVRGDGTPTANGTALRATVNSLASAGSAATPYVVVLSPGTYDLGTNKLMMGPHISLVGAGRGVTMLTGSFNAGSDGFVSVGNGSLLARLSVTNTGAGNHAAVIVYGVSARIVDVEGTGSSSGAGFAYGLVAFSNASAVVEESVFTGTSSTGTAYGAYVVSGSMGRFRDVNVSATGTTSNALAASTSSLIEFVGGSATAATYAVTGGGGTTVRIAHAKLAGPTNLVTSCIGAYDATFAPRTC